MHQQMFTLEYCSGHGRLRGSLHHPLLETCYCTVVLHWSRMRATIYQIKVWLHNIARLCSHKVDVTTRGKHWHQKQTW